MEQWRSRQTIYEGRVFTVDAGTATLPDGRETQRDVVVHHGGVTIAAAVDGQVVMIRQFRIAIGEHLLELPAGMIEGDEDPQMRAATELVEETGYRAKRLELVADYFVSPGYTTERMRIYLADDLRYVGQAPDGDEQVEVVLVPIDAARKMLATGEIRDAKSMIGLRLLLDRL